MVRLNKLNMVQYLSLLIKSRFIQSYIDAKCIVLVIFKQTSIICSDLILLPFDNLCYSELKLSGLLTVGE